MEESTRTRQLSPETPLIGTLLLITGIAGTIAMPIQFWRMYMVMHGGMGSDFGHNPLDLSWGLAYAWELLKLLLAVVCIVSGVGLLRRVPWAKSVAVVVLIGFFARDLLPGLTDRLLRIMSLLPYASYYAGWITEICRTITALLSPLYYWVLLRFLTVPSTSVTMNDDKPVAVAIRILQRYWSRLPRAVSLIVLLLTVQSIPALFVIAGAFRNSSYQSDFSTPASMIATTGTLVAWCCALMSLRWARFAGIGILLVGCAMPILLCIQAIVSAPSGIYSSISTRVMTDAITVLPVSAGYVAMAIYLLRARNTPILNSGQSVGSPT